MCDLPINKEEIGTEEKNSSILTVSFFFAKFYGNMFTVPAIHEYLIAHSHNSYSCLNGHMWRTKRFVSANGKVWATIKFRQAPYSYIYFFFLIMIHLASKSMQNVYSPNTENTSRFQNSTYIFIKHRWHYIAEWSQRCSCSTSCGTFSYFPGTSTLYTEHEPKFFFCLIQILAYHPFCASIML